MSMTLEDRQAEKLVEVHVNGKIDREDYRHTMPELDRLIERQGKVRLLVDMTGFDGWTVGALWEDIKFDARHFSDIERVAMVGEKKWQKNLSWFCRPFTMAKVRYFDRNAMDEARHWAVAA